MRNNSTLNFVTEIESAFQDPCKHSRGAGTDSPRGASLFVLTAVSPASARWSMSVAQPERAGQPAGSGSTHVPDPIPTVLLRSTGINHKHTMGDKETL